MNIKKKCPLCGSRVNLPIDSNLILSQKPYVCLKCASSLRYAMSFTGYLYLIVINFILSIFVYLVFQPKDEKELWMASLPFGATAIIAYLLLCDLKIVPKE